MSRQSLVVMMGIPGSGKSTLAATLGLPVVSLDAVRTDGDDVVRVLARAVVEVESMLTAGLSVVVDSCNLRVQLRRRWMRVGRSASVRCELVVVETDADLAMVRNRARPVRERVSDDAMRRYVRDWPDARGRARAESWDRILVVSGGEPMVGARSREW